MKTKLFILMPVLLLIGEAMYQPVYAQEHLQVSSSERFIAYSLYNFSKLVQWPGSGNTEVFHIAVIGDKQVFAELENLARNKKIGNAVYDIQYYKELGELSGQKQMVYLSNQRSNELEQLILQSQKGVLIVTERRGLTRKGSTISFTTDAQGKMGFEIARDNAAKHNLTIHMQLERMAMSVI